MKKKVTLAKVWSVPHKLPTYFGIKLYYSNPNFEVRIIDFNNPFTKISFELSKIKSPYVLPINNNSMQVNYTFIFRKTNDEDVEIEYELWTPG